MHLSNLPYKNFQESHHNQMPTKFKLINLTLYLEISLKEIKFSI